SLLLQRFPRFGEQAGVLDGNDSLPGEIADQLDLLIGERANLLAVNDEGADQLVLFEHRHGENGPSLGKPGERSTYIGRCRHEVGDLNSLLGISETAEESLYSRMSGIHDRFAPPQCFICRRSVMHRSGPKGASYTNVERAKIGFAEPGGILQHSLE